MKVSQVKAAKEPAERLHKEIRMDSTQVKRIVMCTALLGLIMAQAMIVDAKPSNKWRIKFENRAQSDGDIVFLMQAIDGEPIKITTHIEDNMGENAIAKAVRDAFRAQSPKGFLKKVKTDDGEKVVLKKGSGRADFELSLVSSGVENLHIKIRRE